jgi:hypothetical protein
MAPSCPLPTWRPSPSPRPTQRRKHQIGQPQLLQRALRVPAGRRSAGGNSGSRQRNWSTSEILCPHAKLQQLPSMTRFDGSDFAVRTGLRSPTPWRQPPSHPAAIPATSLSTPEVLSQERPPASPGGQGRSTCPCATRRSHRRRAPTGSGSRMRSVEPTIIEVDGTRRASHSVGALTLQLRSARRWWIGRGQAAQRGTPPHVLDGRSAPHG